MTTTRKAWIKKTPVEIILEQVAKQEEKVVALRKETAKEEGELKKMQDATKLLQAK
jgi:cell division protein FtsB